jgi:hypothetical protein
MRKLFIFFVLLIVFGCNNNKTASRNHLTGKWVVYELPDTEMNKEELDEVIGKATIEFTTDGKYTTTDNEETENGQYLYDEKSGRITMIAPGEDTTILECSFQNNFLTIASKEGKAKLKKAN